MKQRQIERQSLIISIIVNAVTGLAGLAVYIVTDLNALLLDGVFSLIASLSALVGLFISRRSHWRTASFPQGLFFLEPLYAVIKSLAVLFLLLITFLETSATAYAYFVNQIGHQIETGPVLPYTMTTGLICLLLGLYNSRQNDRINNMSTMLKSETKGNYIDAVISLGIGFAAFLLYFIAIEGPLGFLHYTGDFFITVILVLFSIKEPIAILISSFRELTYATTNDQDIRDMVYQILKPHLKHKKDDLDILIYKQGMQITVKIFILDLENTDLLTDLAQEKADLLNQLRKRYEHIRVEYTF